MSPRGRIYLAFAFLSSWLALLLIGVAGGGLVHALLVAAGVCFPWRAVSGSRDGREG